MNIGSRLLALTVVAATTLAFASVGSAAPTSTSFAIAGSEYAFTSTVGSFAGTGLGNAGDAALWNATVRHDPLGSTPTHVTGGSVELETSNANGHVDSVEGTLANGGTITTISSGPNCTNQQFLVNGTLENVTTNSTSGGSGTFTVTLTHYRFSLFGHCVIYRASVRGSVSFAY
jgi:hypothetical protein